MSKSVTQAFPWLVWLVCFVVVISAACETHAAEPTDNAASAVIHLTNGDYATGRLVDSQGSSRLAWQSPAFTGPFEFSIQAMNTIQFPIPAKLIQPEGAYCFELAGGDVLFGSLVALQGNEAGVEVAGIGRLHVERSLLRRMYRWQGGTELLFSGPSGLKGWTTSGAAKAWREESGHLLTDQSGAVLQRDFSLPAMARVEFELSWKAKPDFELALGASDSKSALRAFRFEVWENELVVQRETERDADLTSLQPAQPGPGRIHLQAFLDQPKGRLLVFSSGGMKLADLTVTTTKPQTLGGLQLTNKSGDVRLERLSIGRWNGEPPRSVDASKSRLHTTDGAITYGQLQSYDAATREFVVETNEIEERFAEERVQDVYFSQENKVAPRPLRAVHHSGLRISGELVKVDANNVWIKCPGIREDVAFLVGGLHALTVLDPRDVSLASAERPQPATRIGRLEVEGCSLHGNLTESREREGCCLIWQPTRSASSSPLRSGVSARIVYRDTSVSAQALTQQQMREEQARQRQAQAGGRMVGPMQDSTSDSRAATVPKHKQPKSTKPVLHLRSGDTIPCDVTAIDEQGVTFASSITEATFIRHDQLKALEILAEAAPVQIARVKKERLLMLPRMQRDNPPTHLVRSIDGDYLRGRLVSMDEQQLQIEIRLETKTLQRDRVARIIWLHPDETDGEVPPKVAENKPATLRVQALSELSEFASKGDQDRNNIQNRRIQTELLENTEIAFTDNSIEEVFVYMKDLHGIPIELDSQALKDAGIKGGHPITLTVKGITLNAALKLMLEPLKLAHVVDRGVLKITTVSKAADLASSQNRSGDGNRLTFFAEELVGTTLSGRSELLGGCRVDLNIVDQLLIGRAIEQAAATLAFHQWRLKAAADPLDAKEGGGGSGEGMEGQDAALVGKPAPEIELDLLDGKKFRLSEHKGRIVVLDFWASWCGPCLQVMPQIDKVTHEFADQGVELFAINLEETPAKVKAALERLKLTTTVALDSNGRVAEKYGATSIPQTVVIDRSGKVARLFVGGGSRFGDQLRTALQAVLSDKSETNH